MILSLFLKEIANSHNSTIISTIIFDTLYFSSIAQKRRYLPHEITTKIHSVETYRQTSDIGYVCRKYHVSKASLMRWNKRYDGTRESLAKRSHRPLHQHPRAHSEEELKWITDLHRRNPNISLCEMYGKLVAKKGYSRLPGSLYRVFVRLGYRRQVESTKRNQNTWEHTIRRSSLVRSGKRTSSMCQRYAMQQRMNSILLLSY